MPKHFSFISYLIAYWAVVWVSPLVIGRFIGFPGFWYLFVAPVSLIYAYKLLVKNYPPIQRKRIAIYLFSFPVLFSAWLAWQILKSIPNWFSF